MSILQIKKLRHEEAKDFSYQVSDVEFETRTPSVHKFDF